MTNDIKQTGVSRRTFIKGAAAAAGAGVDVTARADGEALRATIASRGKDAEPPLEDAPGSYVKAR